MNSRTSVMVSIVLAMLVASMDSMIMNTTMPIITKELGGFSLYAWSFASYYDYNDRSLTDRWETIRPFW